MAVLRELLNANFYWTGSGGGTLSRNGHTGTVYLQVREPMSLVDLGRLKDLLHAIVMNAEFWRTRLATLTANPPSIQHSEPALGTAAMQV